MKLQHVRWIVIIAGALWLGRASHAAAQEGAIEARSTTSLSARVDRDGIPIATPRGVHVRSAIAPLVGATFTFSTVRVAAGALTGIELVVHPRHEVGVRVSYAASFVPGEPAPSTTSWFGFAIDYRWHLELTPEQVVPYFEIVGGVALADDCSGDLCGTIGAHGSLGVGGELELERHASWFFGAQVAFFAGLFVSPMVQPVALTGMRFG